MIKPVLYIVFFLSAFSLKAQVNLVPNGSFEELFNCPMGADIENAVGWYSPSNGTPDLYNSCADISQNCSVPINSYGYQQAHDGLGYAGIVTYGDGSNYREYIASKLTTPLKKGAIYRIVFFVSLANTSPIAVNNIAIEFFQDSIHNNSPFIISGSNETNYPFIISDTLNWHKITFLYCANGSENFIAIGNFHTDIDTEVQLISSNIGEQYLYIDDVEVIEVLDTISNVFTPNNDSINEVIFKFPFSAGESIFIMNRWGTVVKKTNFAEGWNGLDTNDNQVSEGVYFYSIYLNKAKVKAGFFHLIK